MPVKRECCYEKCPVEAALDLIGGKWRTMIIALLLDSEFRFNELQRRIGGVSHKVLTEQLRDLEQCGIIKRQEIHVTPPMVVVYSLTDLGFSLRPLVEELRRWGEKFAVSQSQTTER